MLTITIPHIIAYGDPDNDIAIDDKGDYYALITIAGNTLRTNRFDETEGTITTNWKHTFEVGDNDTAVPVSIALWDFDSFAAGDDDEIDINPIAGKKVLDISVDMVTGRWTGDVPFGSFAEGNGDTYRGRAVFFVDTGSSLDPQADTDGDGISDLWELRGVDIDNDGTIDLPLPGANPYHKDLYVEVDSMIGLTAKQAAMNDVIAAFAAAPNSLIGNPDGLDGVALHIQLDETDIPRAVFQITNVEDWPTGFDTIKRNELPGTPGGLGTVAERSNVANFTKIREAKLQIYRYCIFADQLSAKEEAWGRAELPGNDFMMLLGTADSPGGTQAQQAATFMHELGHTLGLGHGGSLGTRNGMLTAGSATISGIDTTRLLVGMGVAGKGIPPQAKIKSIDVANQSITLGNHDGTALVLATESGSQVLHIWDNTNRKPNYHSIMNYSWTYKWRPDAAAEDLTKPNELDFRASYKLDYSRIAFPDLDENNLDETVGLRGPAGHEGHFTGIGGPRQDAGAPWNHYSRFEKETGPIDFDRDGTLESSSKKDLDGTGALILQGNEDWSKLLYDFRGAPNFADGEHTSFEIDSITQQEAELDLGLLTYDAPAGNVADNLTLRKNGANYEIVNSSNVVVASRAIADTWVVWVFTDGGDDTLTIDFTNGAITLDLGVYFDGGTGNDQIKTNANVDHSLDGESLFVGSLFVSTERVESASLVGGAAKNKFVVSNYFGNATLDGKGEDDTYEVNLHGLGSSTVAIKDTGSGGADAATVNGAGEDDTFSVTSTETARGNEKVTYDSNLETLLVNALGGADAFNVKSTGPATELDGGTENDVYNVSSDAPTNTGNLDGITGALTVKAGAGTANRLIVSDHSSAGNSNVEVTHDTITGLAPAAIKYSATGGNFSNGASNDGIRLIGSDSGADVFIVKSTLTGSTTKIETRGGDDKVYAGSDATADDGKLDALKGLLTLDTGAGTDLVHVNDRGTPLDSPSGGQFNYTIDASSVSNNTTDPPGHTRDFAGIKYEGAQLERLELIGTNAANVFDVKPSLTTTYFIHGKLPAAGEGCATDGDFLKLDTAGTEGRELHITSTGAGKWDFTSGHKDVEFESIERFNHVDIIAVAADSGKKSRPLVRVYDAETLEHRFDFYAYDVKLKYGVRVATGDLNNDGLPDIVTAPGRNWAPEIRVFSWVGGSEIVDLRLTPEQTYGKKFKGGVNLAVGALNGGGCNQLVLAPDRGAVNVLVFRNHLGSWQGVGQGFKPFADYRKFIGGASVAIANTDIIVSAGSGMAGLIRVFDIDGLGSTLVATQVREIKNFTPKFRGGWKVASGDVDNDGVFDIIAAAGKGGSSWIQVFDGEAGAGNTPLHRFQTFTDVRKNKAALHVTARDQDGDGAVEIYAAQGQDGRNDYAVAIIDPLTEEVVDRVFAGNADFFGGGVNLG